MILKLFLFVILFSQLFCLFTGDGTFYNATGGGTCSFDESNANPLLVAALNQPDWDGSNNCGRCAKIWGPYPDNPSYKNPVTVQIVDKCPECLSGDLDLSEDAFAMLAPMGDGRIDISWEYVDCDVSGLPGFQIHTKNGSNEWWVAFQVRDSRIGINMISVKSNGVWYDLSRTDYNYFIKSFSSGVGTQFVVRVEGINNEKFDYTINSYIANYTFQTSYQFDASSASINSILFGMALLFFFLFF
ncbi:hypothetical protein M0811_04755 [Anaeramoeba ignava]|uniref:Expansin-like EG45 domain-containing protein n=1 Tax=Anaeramoeba ignava TaxID=1746090 RepID=A0A9Q0LTI6_ANAIG|nr:hypothetical protein M0811_04755 [Anaeramoeba ignava]